MPGLPPNWPRKGVTLPDKPVLGDERLSPRVGRLPVAFPPAGTEPGSLPGEPQPGPAGLVSGRRPGDLPFRLAFGVREAARIVGVSHSAISREIAAGRLKAKRYGRRVLIRPRDLRDWLSSLPDA
ncbi:MAG: helix-turn-helix domain-containing protein [Bacillota bacterium]